MKRIVLFEDDGVERLLPLVCWRTVFELRLGRRLLFEGLQNQLGATIAGVWTRDLLADVTAERLNVPVNTPIEAGAVLVNGRWVPQGDVTFGEKPCVGICDGEIAYVCCDARLAKLLRPDVPLDQKQTTSALKNVPRIDADGWVVDYLWDLISKNAAVLRESFQPGDASIESAVDSRVILDNPDAIHIGSRVRIHPTCVIDATAGPITIDDDVTIGPFCVIEGPAYIGTATRINPHARLHGGNSIGPYCKLGGEIDGCIIHGYTNKQHAGFLGHSYVGSWVNLGAGTNNSDLKNTYGPVRVTMQGVEVDTGLQFFGAVIGDHVKTAINTTIPTGTVIGFAAMTATRSTLPKLVPSFAWLTDAGLAKGDPKRLLQVASQMMSRRNVTITEAQKHLFMRISR